MNTSTATTAMHLHPESFLWKVSQGFPLISSKGQEVPREIPFKKWDTTQRQWVPTMAKIASVDNGNDAFKGAMMHLHRPTLVTKRLVTAYAPAKTIRAGEGITTWQVNDSEPFWIGDDAVMAKKAESLPIGFTAERVPDDRYQSFLAACLVELLIEAGYEMPVSEWQGEHDLYVSFGIPNEEMTLQGAKPEVSRALRVIFNVAFTVRRTDEQGRVSTWLIRLVEINPFPQSFASFATWYYTVDGTPIQTDIVKHVTLDIGGGQFHDCEVDLLVQDDGRVKLRMSANLLGDGTIAIARAARDVIRARYPGVRLSDAEAQRVLMTKRVIVGGRLTPVDDIVADVVTARSQNLFTQMLPLVQEGQNFLMFTGGGSVLLAHSLYQMVQPTRSQSQFFFVPPDLSPVLNAIGGHVLAQAMAQKILATVEQQRLRSASIVSR